MSIIKEQAVQMIDSLSDENAFFRVELDVIFSEVIECKPQVIY